MEKSNKVPHPWGENNEGEHPLTIFKYCPVCGSAHFALR